MSTRCHIPHSELLLWSYEIGDKSLKKDSYVITPKAKGYIGSPSSFLGINSDVLFYLLTAESFIIPCDIIVLASS